MNGAATRGPIRATTKALRIRAEVMSITTTKATMMIMTAQVSA